VVEPWLPSRTRWQRASFMMAVSLIAAVESVRINHRLPPGTFRQWTAWLARRRHGETEIGRAIRVLGSLIRRDDR
jgi:hypothetical protein